MTLFKEIQEILNDKFGININNIKEDSLLKEDLGLDSIDLMELVILFEEKYNVKIEDDELFKIKSIKDIVKLIKKMKEE